jgi:probable HAF family extracellular repeat protein
MADLGDLPGGRNSSSAHAINASGQVTGYSDTATGSHAMLWTPSTPNGASGSMFDLGDLPGGSESSLG